MLIISPFLFPFLVCGLEIFLLKIITSLNGLKNKTFSLTELKGPFFLKSLSLCKEIFLTFPRDFLDKHAFQSLLRVDMPGHVIVIFVMVASMELLT